jgi:hypothetical protein
MSSRWSERNHVVKGLDPVADAFDSTVYSDVVSMKGHNSVAFIVYKGVGTTGTSTLTVEACDDFVPTNVTAVAFRYRRCANTADAQGALTAAASTGFTTTAGSSEIYVIEVLAEDLASSGYGNVRLKAVEVVNSPVLGGILIVMGEPTYAQAIQPTVIS